MMSPLEEFFTAINIVRLQASMISKDDRYLKFEQYKQRKLNMNEILQRGES